MNSSSIQQSTLFDNGDYFYDDDFTVPFDANLRHNLSSHPSQYESQLLDQSQEAYNGSRSQYCNHQSSYSTGLVHAKSDTCIHHHNDKHASSTHHHHNHHHHQPMHTKNEHNYPMNETRDISEMTDSVLPNDLLFSHNSMMLTESLGTSNISVSAMEQSFDMRSRKLLNSSFVRDNYHLTYGNNAHQGFDSPEVNFGSLNSESSGSNLSSWALKAAVKKAALRDSELQNVPGGGGRGVGGAGGGYSGGVEKKLTSWEKRKSKTDQQDQQSRNSSLETSSRVPPGQTLLHMYSAHRGLDFNMFLSQEGGGNRDSVPSNADDNPVTLRKARSFSHRLRPTKYSSRTQPSVDYPGVGAISLPKSSKLENQAFLSKTLPDLSFLVSLSSEKSFSSRQKKSSAQRRHVTSISSDNASLRSFRRGSEPNFLLHPTSIHSQHHHQQQHIDSDVSIDISVHEVVGVHEDSPVPMVIPRRLDSTTGSPMKKSNSAMQLTNNNSSSLSKRSGGGGPLKSCLVRRSSSGNENLSNEAWRLDRTISMPNAINDNSTSYNDNTDDEAYPDDLENGSLRTKKSVSFSDRIQLMAMEESSDLHTADVSTLKTRCIPRDWGLYGQDLLVAEFPLLYCGENGSSSQTTVMKQSPIITRFVAMIQDVVIAVERLKSAYHHLANLLFEASNDSAATVDAATTTAQEEQEKNNYLFSPYGSHPLLLQTAAEFVSALCRLLSDGLLPVGKQLFAKKARSRLWALIEDSCRPGTLHRVVAEALRETKTYSFLVTDKAKFKAFVFICLNCKALSLWWTHLVENEVLLKRFYSEDSFLLSLKEEIVRNMYMDLLESMDSLLNFPFDLPILREVPGTGPPTPAPAAVLASSSKPTAVGTAAAAVAANKRSFTFNNKSASQSSSVNSFRTTTAAKKPATNATSLPPSLANKFRSRGSGAISPIPSSPSSLSAARLRTPPAMGAAASSSVRSSKPIGNVNSSETKIPTIGEHKSPKFYK